jgi:hypothetical protein
VCLSVGVKQPGDLAIEPDAAHNPFPFATHNVCIDPASNSLVRKVKALIQECVESHRCEESDSESRAMPKRLLRLDGRLCLCSPEEPLRYTALSYCWGGYKHHQTESSNVAGRYEDIDYSTLPQTLKDAILFTRKLGVDYIWIDSICIVQDDRDEWAEEAAKMADIYSGAYVVLAATRATNAAEGFLQHHSDPYEITSRTSAEQTFTIQAHHVNNHIYNDTIRLNNQPLSRRGWCLQEELLAPRILHFLPSEVYYACKETGHCECGYARGNRSGYHIRWPPLISVNERDDIPFWCHSWLEIVRNCSKRSFTFPEDVLPAISGLAQRIGSMHTGRYIAGIWEAGIAFQLGWYGDASSPDLLSPTRTAVTKPTFSWITSPLPVNHLTWFFDVDSPMCDLMSARLITATSDPFGRLTYASITLHGQQLPGIELVSALSNRTSDIHDKVRVRRTPHEIPSVITDLGQRFPSAATDLVRKFPRRISFDKNYTGISSFDRNYNGVSSVLDWSSVTCFSLYIASDRLCMLLLRQCTENETYSRVGLTYGIPKAWFNTYATECTITIE